MENENTKILKSIEENSDMSLVQGGKMIEAVNELEPIMEGVLVKTNELITEQKKTNELLSKEEEPKPEVQKVKLEGIEVITLKGDKGDKGEVGEQGIQGERGEQGEQGIQGEKGEAGEKGDKGEKGDTGKQGIAGPKGDKGEKGLEGKTGKQGSTDTPEQVKSKLLEVGLDYEEIKNTPDLDKIIAITSQSSKTVSLVELDDVNLTGLTQTNGKYDLGSGGGSSVSVNGAEVTDPDLIDSPTIAITNPSGSNVVFDVVDESIDGNYLAPDAVATDKIANDAVTNGKLANMATQTFKGRTTAGNGDPEDLTVTQALAMLSVDFPIFNNNYVDSVAASATTYYAFGGQAVDSTTESNRQGIMPVNCRAFGFYVRTSSTQNAGGSLVFTIIGAAGNTAITLTVAAGSAAGVFSDTTNAHDYDAGDRTSIKVVNNYAGGVSATIAAMSLGGIKL